MSKVYEGNVYGVYRPHGGEEMPITVDWSDEDCSYHIKVVGADIEILVDDDEASSPQEAFNLAEEDIALETARYAFTHY
jgi:hypothetical protein